MDKDKFNTCQFRSDTEIEKVIIGCCYTTKTYGWYCNRKGIAQLSPLHCINCEIYQKRESSEDQNSPSEGNL